MGTFLWVWIGVGATGTLVFVWAYNWFNHSKTRLEEAHRVVDIHIRERLRLAKELPGLMAGSSAELEGMAQSLAHPGAHAAPGAARVSAPSREHIRKVLVRASENSALRDNAALESFVESFEKAGEREQMAMRYYNALARTHNTRRRSFPMGLMAAILGIQEVPYYDEEDTRRDD